MAVGRATKEETGGHGALLGAAGGSGTAGKGAGGRPRPGCVRAGRWAAGAPEEAPLPRRRSAGTAVAVGGGGRPARHRSAFKEKKRRRVEVGQAASSGVGAVGGFVAVLALTQRWSVVVALTRFGAAGELHLLLGGGGGRVPPLVAVLLMRVRFRDAYATI